MSRELPAGWSTRRPSLDDVPAILDVVHASDIAAVGEPDFSADDVREILNSPNHDPQRDSWLALNPDGRVSAWAYVENHSGGHRDGVEVYVHPEFGALAQAPLLEMALERVAARAAESGRPAMTARAGAIPTEERYIAILRAAGFTFIKRYARMKRELTGAETAPELPPGWVIRPINRPDPATEEAELRVFHEILDNAFRDTPDYEPHDFAAYRARLAALPTIPWDEWLVAEVDGVPVGVAQSTSQSLEGSEGWVRNLAVAEGLPGPGRRAGPAEHGVRHLRGQGAGQRRAGRGHDEPHRRLSPVPLGRHARGLRGGHLRARGDRR